MEQRGRVNFLEFLAQEEHNVLASLCNLREEFDLFFNLDQVYKAPLDRLKPKPDDMVVPQLYLFVHYHLYSSVASILRVHLAEALASTRKAIDGALTAYELIKHPEKTTEYLNGSRHFVNIKAAVKKSFSQDADSYPLAKGLIGLHEHFSHFGSHADFSGFAHRLRVTRRDDGDTSVDFDYFHKPDNDVEFRYYFACLLHAYYRIFLIFRKYFDTQFRIFDSQWEGRIAELEEVLPRQVRTLKSRLERK